MNIKDYYMHSLYRLWREQHIRLYWFDLSHVEHLPHHSATLLLWLVSLFTFCYRLRVVAVVVKYYCSLMCILQQFVFYCVTLESLSVSFSFSIHLFPRQYSCNSKASSVSVLKWAAFNECICIVWDNRLIFNPSCFRCPVVCNILIRCI